MDDTSQTDKHLTADANAPDSKRQRSENDVKGPSRLQEALSIVEILTPDELVELAKKVTLIQKTLPMVLSEVPTNLMGKFSIYDKGFAKEAPEFKYYVDTVHLYKLVWSDGEEMDLKLVNYTGFIYAGTTMFEVQGLKVGPLLITAAFPESDRLPDTSGAEDLEEGVAELVKVCKQHGVTFQDSEEFTSFVDWLMQYAMDGSTQFLYGVVIDGALGEGYDNLFGQEDEDNEGK